MTLNMSLLRLCRVIPPIRRFPLLCAIFFTWFPPSCFSSPSHPSSSSSSSSSSHTSYPYSSSCLSSSSSSRPSFMSFPAPPCCFPLLLGVSPFPASLVIVITSPPCWFLSLRRYHPVRLPIVPSPSFLLLTNSIPLRRPFCSSSPTLILTIDSSCQPSSSTLLVNPPYPHRPSTSSSSTLLANPPPPC